MDNEFKKYREETLQKLANKAKIYGIYRFTLQNADGTKEVKFYHNVITESCFEMIANNFVDPTPTNAMEINYALLGTDATAVAETDTMLGTETYRNAIASKTNSGGTIYATAYFSQAECNGTYKEAGIVSDGTASVDTGVLVSHVNIDVEKTITQSLTIDWEMGFVNA